jgi:hypothetical protein
MPFLGQEYVALPTHYLLFSLYIYPLKVAL